MDNFDKYKKSYEKGECPFCGSDDFIGHNDIIYCKGSGGYLSLEDCDQYASDGDGHCKYCRDGDFSDREEVNENTFLCNDCNKGVDLEKKIVFDGQFD